MSKKSYTNEELLYYLKKFYKENGRSPMQMDLGNKNGYPSMKVYRNRFGSLNNALQLADLTLNNIPDYSKSFLISELYRFIEENNRTPTFNDMYRNKGYPPASSYMKVFGGWNKALINAKIDINKIKKYDKFFLQYELYRYVEEFNKIPTQIDIDDNPDYPSLVAYTTGFGTFNNALISCGFSPNRIIHEYDGSEYCYICGSHTTCDGWNYDENDNRLCSKCDSKIWAKNNPLKIKKYRHISNYKRRGYGSTPLNKTFKNSHGHHLWLESRSNFVIFIPSWLHNINWHNHNRPDTMSSVNAIALDYWINEDLYKNLFLTGEIDD